MRYREKIVDLKSLLFSIQNAKFSNKTVIFTNGIWDLIHAGHTDLLNFCKNINANNIVIVGINSDKSTKQNKEPDRPINNLENRSKVLSAISFVDYIVAFNDKSVLNLVKSVKPDVLVKGSEYSVKKIIGSDYVKSYGGKVLQFTMIEGVSTTNIIEKING